MRRTYLGLIAAGLMAACGLDTAGDLSADAGDSVVEAAGGRDGKTAPGRDAGHSTDATVSGDADRETGAPPSDARSDGSDGSTKDAPGDSKVSDGGSKDGGKGDAEPDASGHDASAHDGGDHDAGEHDAGEHEAGDHDASEHDAGNHDAGVHDAGEDGSITQPPGLCFLGYSCGSASCNCNQTCAGDHCGPCINHYTTCGGGETCGTDLSSILSCGSCTNTCSCDPLNSYPSCNPTGSTYACACNPY